MSFHRATLVALATLFTVGMTSLASACCGGWGYGAPVAYAGYGGYGGFGGCGGCGAPTAAVVYAQPVAPAPIVVGGWGGSVGWGGGWGGGCGCGACGCRGLIGGYGGWGAPSPLYVVNQGPAYTGPGLMVPYGGYTPDTAYAPAVDYPYVPGYGVAAPAYNPYFEHLYYRPRYAYRGPAYVRARYYGPGPRYYHRPWRRW
jgi:hypothetical protein